jgi:hypothetical membrane protein
MQRPEPQRLAGLLLAVSGSVILMGIITAEALYPADFTTNPNAISDLRATKPPDSAILQPSASIFNVTMIVTGLAVIAAAVLLIRTHDRRFLTTTVLLNGIGILGVGVFPGNVGAIHPWFALLAFIAGGLCGIAGWRARTGPVSWFSFALGTITLGTLAYALFGGLDAPLLDDLGDGGTERWVAYPVVLWQVMFGGALMAGSLPATAATATHAAGESPGPR